MGNGAEIAQVAVEFLVGQPPPCRVCQVAVEVLYGPSDVEHGAAIAQVAVEVLTRQQTVARAAQVAVEALVGNQLPGSTSVGSAFGGSWYASIITPTKTIQTVVFPFEPNWNDPPKLTLRSFTDLHPTTYGREQRVARYPDLSVMMKMTIDTQFDPDVSRAVARLLLNNIGNRLMIPIWSEMAFLTSPISAGAKAIYTTSTDSSLFSADRPCLLWKSNNYFDLVVPSSDGVTENQITTVYPISQDYSALDRVIPIMFTDQITDKFAKNWQSGFQLTSAMTLRESLPTMQPLAFSVTMPAFRGLPIFPFRFQRAEQYQGTAEAELSSVKDDIERNSAFVTELRPRENIKATILLDGRTSIATAMYFASQAQGRFGAFWCPSDQPDFQVLSTNSGSKIMTVTDYGYSTGDFSNPARRLLLIRDSGWVAVGVTAAVDNGNGTETLTLTTGLALSQNALVSYLYLMRLNIDDVLLTFDHPQLAACELEFLELPYEVDPYLTGSDTNGNYDDQGTLLG